MSKINKYKILVLFLLALMLVGFNNCVPEAPTQQKSAMNLPSGEHLPPPPKTEGAVLVAMQLSTGVKSFEQILHTMSTLTGVPVSHSNIKSTYAQVVESLPTDNNAKTFITSHQVAVTKLAAEFCHVLTDNAALREQIWPGFNFGLALRNGAFTAENQRFIILSAIDAFWIIATESEKEKALEELLPLFESLIEGEATNSTTVTRNVTKGVCTAILSSAHVTLL